jgi:6-phosphogluconolactonase
MVEILKLSTPELIASYIGQCIADTLKLKPQANIAVSGGSTPLEIFKHLKHLPIEIIGNARFFWADERCVPYSSDESNYGLASRILLDGGNISASQLLPFDTSCAPSISAARYSSQLLHLQAQPLDLLLLGIGDDGHTASIFPGQESLLLSPNQAEKSVNPYTGQERVTLAGKALSRAIKTVFIATGKAKHPIINEIVSGKAADKYPAAMLISYIGQCTLVTDSGYSF